MKKRLIPGEKDFSYKSEPASKMAERPARSSAENRRAILDAASHEFAGKGFDGARIDAIAARAGSNKRMLYHYFGKKDMLYLAVLEETYRGIRSAEAELDLGHLEPVEGIRRLVLFTWEYFIAHPEFLDLLNTENLLRGEFLKQSEEVRDLQSPLVGQLNDLLVRGVEADVFRSDVDAVQLYITIAGLGFFYISNRWTLSTIFDRNLAEPAALAERGAHMVAVILDYLRAK